MSVDVTMFESESPIPHSFPLLISSVQPRSFEEQTRWPTAPHLAGPDLHNQTNRRSSQTGTLFNLCG